MDDRAERPAPGSRPDFGRAESDADQPATVSNQPAPIPLVARSAESHPPPASATIHSVTARKLAALVERDARYRVIGEISAGPSSTVLEVLDQDLHRHVAMKVASSTFNVDDADNAAISQPRSIARFLQEAEIMAQLVHPGIVPVHDLGVECEGHAYFTMALVHGRQFSDIVRQIGTPNSGWSTSRALETLIRVCDTMEYAHSRGVVHRDLKPANIMVGQFGEVFVMDWGLARAPMPGSPLEPNGTDASMVDFQDSAMAVTLHGQVVGTPAFMPPEQAIGDLEAMGPRSDVYSLGATLYTLLAGRMPYVSPGKKISEVLDAVVAGPPIPVRRLSPEAPAELVAITEKAMARAPDERYASMEALGEEIRASLEGRVVQAHRIGATEHARKWMLRNRWLLALVIVSSLAIVLASALSGLRYVAAESDRKRDAVVTKLCSQIQQDTANAHLWFEEALAGDSSIDLDQHVHSRIKDAKIAAQRLAHSVFPSFNGKEKIAISKQPEKLFRQLEVFEETTKKRWRLRATEGRTGGLLDQGYDVIYDRIRESCGAIEAFSRFRTEQAWKSAAKVSLIVQMLAAACFLITAAALTRRLAN